MDVRAKQRLSYQRLSLNSELRAGGFAPRHLKRSASSLDMEKRVAKVDGLYLQGEPSERFSGTVSFELRSDCVYYQWRIKTKEEKFFKAMPISFRAIPKDEDSFEFALKHSLEGLRRYRSNRQKVFEIESYAWLNDAES